MNDFYKSISEYYGEIFPADEKKIKFILHASRFGEDLLDVACGSGEIAKSLIENGKRVIGIDLEESMVKLSKENGVDAYVMDLRNISFDKKFDVIYCIGNSLSHLDSLDEVDDYLFQMPRLLKKNGHFIVQIVNFSKFWRSDAKDGELLGTLPTIENDNVKFERNYYKDGDKIRFNTVLTSDGKKIENNQLLLPIMPDELIDYIVSIGFSVKIYGGFDKTIEFNKNSSPAFIIKGSKI